MFTYIPKPDSNDATLVSSTGRREDVRMSTSGSAARSSHGTHSVRTANEVTQAKSVAGPSHPQSLLFEMARSIAVSATDSRPAPTKSNLPGLRTDDSGTTSGTRRSISADDTADTQKRACQPAWAWM